MKVLIICNCASGLLHFRSMLIKEMVNEGINVTAVVPSTSDIIEHQCEKDLEELNCSIIRVPIDRRGINPLKDLVLFFTYRQIIRSCNPDAVLLYTVKPNVYGGLACRLENVPYISTITGLGTAIENSGPLQILVVLLYRIGLKNAFAVIFQNMANKELFEKKRIGRNYQIVSGSGVDLDRFHFEPYPSKESTIRLTFVGRIMRDKGILELLDAANSIKKSFPHVQFDLIGGFDEEFQDVVQKATDTGIVNYLGEQKDVKPFYAESWAIIMPSYHEGLSNVCLEAASTGRPILASNVPGCIETFDDGVSGIGFEVKSATALTAAIEKFIALSYQEKKEMGEFGRKKMEREFDRHQVVRAYLNQINKLRG